MRSHIAQVNIAALRAPLEHDSISDFRDGLDPVNAAGEASPGFVWRLQTDDGDATSIRVSDDPLNIVNLTVWQSVAALRQFVYAGLHRDFLRRRSEWFSDVGRRTAVWPVPEGSLPSVDDALRRLAFIDQFGESPYAYRSVASSRSADRPVLVLAEHPLDATESLQLIAELNSELLATSAPEERHFSALDAGQVVAGAGQFVVAWLDGRPVACGAFRLIGDGTAEVKRMFVRPTARGHKIGAAVLHELETLGIAAGATRLALETGARLAPALTLYDKAGFTPCECWGDYAEAADSVCFEKRIA